MTRSSHEATIPATGTVCRPIICRTILCLNVCLGLGLGLSACAWDVGEPFATLSPRIDARMEIPAERDVGDGWQRLPSDYEVRINSFELDAGDLFLIDSGGATQSFDPAAPPAGYSLCHNGHCHADDGGLVAYEDIAAGVAQGTGATRVMALDIGSLDLVAGVERALACEPDCELPLVHVEYASVDLFGVRMSGQVRDSAVPARLPGELSWSLDFAPTQPDGEPAVLSGPLDLPADRQHAPDVALSVELSLSSAILDNVTWADIPEPLEPVTDIDTLARVSAGLAESQLNFHVQR